jgi:hypothetical protein
VFLLSRTHGHYPCCYCSDAAGHVKLLTYSLAWICFQSPATLRGQERQHKQDLQPDWILPAAKRTRQTSPVFGQRSVFGQSVDKRPDGCRKSKMMRLGRLSKQGLLTRMPLLS